MPLEPIAIVGRGCALPGALRPAELWEAVARGSDLITSCPAGYWQMDPALMLAGTDDSIDDRTWTDRGGYVRGFDNVFDVKRDARDFAIPPEEFAGLDPLFHWLLYAGREALREARVEHRSIDGSRAGIVLGNLSYPTQSFRNYAEAVFLDAQPSAFLSGRAREIIGLTMPDARNRYMSGFPALLLQKALGWSAGAYALDAACASSLYALKLACDQLREGAADLMLAGGVNHSDDLLSHVGFSALQAISRTGQSRPFHRDADGLLPAEGAALVVLKRLEDAVRAGDRIFGVIRAVGVSNDGRSRGLLVPAAEGQRRAIESAYGLSGLRPADISLIECHATGTQIGDATEIESMSSVYRGLHDVPIGSLKSNLGHLVTASGIAGLLKILGAMEAGVRPPTLHAGVTIDQIASSPFRVLHAAEPWEVSGVRRAAINSFGFGGNNAHLIVEEFDGTAPARISRKPIASPIAVVAMEVLAGDGADTASFVDDLREKRSRVRPQPGHADGAFVEAIDLPLTGLRFPPADLDETLGQQLLVLKAALRIMANRSLPGERTSVLIGMGCDAAVARYPVRWKLRDWAPCWAASMHAPMRETWLAQAAESVAPLHRAAGVLGAMPNIIANRLCHQFGLGGPSFVVSAEEDSGLVAQDLAMAALRRGEIDAALVGAVDLCCDPVHRAASKTVDGDAYIAPGDAAVLFLLKREEDAVRDGDSILAILGDQAGDSAPVDSRSLLHALFGHAHACFGSLEMAAAIVNLHAGDRNVVSVRGIEEQERRLYQAHHPLIPLPPIEFALETMAPAPAVPPAPGPDSEAAAETAAPRHPPLQQHALLVETHLRFVDLQAEVHRQFLALRERSLQTLLDVYGAPDSPPAAHPGPQFDRAQLEALASGALAPLLGDEFAVLDTFAHVTRLPEPPFLLIDRITGIDAEPLSDGLGVIWSETDVLPDSWFIHDGVMPGGIFAESTQADLLLICWLGVDLHHRGERVYRVLGCDLASYGRLPRVGDTIQCELRITQRDLSSDLRLFRFECDCYIDGQLRLTLRNVQAGFFTAAELQPSGTPLFEFARCDSAASFSRKQVLAFSEGRAQECFGPDFLVTQTHLRTPSIPRGRMLRFDEVTHFDPHGGSHGLGYLRARSTVHPDAWFLKGHFKDDPCMPGSLVCEGAFQAAAFFLAARGFTLNRDAWRFEPVTGAATAIRNRGQVTPETRELVYELHVREQFESPVPGIWTDVTVIADGREILRAERAGVQLLPDWPIDHFPQPSDDPAGFGPKQFLNWAAGPPSLAFGPLVAAFDSGLRHLGRVPSPPLLLATRVTRITGTENSMEAGNAVELEYEIPPQAWYFDESAARAMPFCVLFEAALQACGWLSIYTGFASNSEADLYLRAIEGDVAVLGRVTPADRILRTAAQLTAVTSVSGAFLLRFEMETFAKHDLENARPVLRATAVLGLFSREALSQPEAVSPRTEPEDSPTAVDLTARPHRYFAGPLRLSAGLLPGLRRITAISATRVQAEMSIDPAAWYFKSHFFGDPVQPGSFGIEAMLELLRFFAIENDLARDLTAPEFVYPPSSLKCKYSKAVHAGDGVAAIDLEITRVQTDADGITIAGDATLSVAGAICYRATNLAIRIVPGASPRNPPVIQTEEFVFDPQKQSWINDHRPNYTLPVMPMMNIVDLIVEAALEFARPRGSHAWKLESIDNLQLRGWLICDTPRRLQTIVRLSSARASDAIVDQLVMHVSLLAWRAAATAELSRFELIADGTVTVAHRYREAPLAWLPPLDYRPKPDPYRSGELFHGPAFQLQTSLSVGRDGSSAQLDAALGAVPRGALHPGLLDAALHGILPDDVAIWAPKLERDAIPYPFALKRARFFEDAPVAGAVRCETRFAGFEDGPKFPEFELQLITGNTRVWAQLELVQVTVPNAAPSLDRGQRIQFIRDRQFIPQVGLSVFHDGITRLARAEVQRMDWLRGSVAHCYLTHATDFETLVEEVAIKEHVAQLARVHPSHVTVLERGAASVAGAIYQIQMERVPDGVVIRNGNTERDSS
jgi:3-oxoacyl-(acyl-carrier-protein) synthase/3-hydroxymyristoyl/3-hydroxydecanoyl-(acyl carrier protein) dehydratase